MVSDDFRLGMTSGNLPGRLTGRSDQMGISKRTVLLIAVAFDVYNKRRAGSAR